MEAEMTDSEMGEPSGHPVAPGIAPHNSNELSPESNEADGIEKEKRVKTCHSCQGHIEEERIHRVGGFSWHSDCLRCYVCDEKFNMVCHFKLGRLYCLSDYQRFFKLLCSGCGLAINQSQFIQRSASGLYHLECFYCVICGHHINQGSQYYEARKPGSCALVCKRDFEGKKAEDFSTYGKRPRTVLTSEQVQALRKVYDENKKPSQQVRECLSKETGLGERVIQVWFQNRRSTDKKQLSQSE